MYQGYVTDWLKCSILNFTIGPVVFYICVELDCKKWCVCVNKSASKTDLLHLLLGNRFPIFSSTPLRN